MRSFGQLWPTLKRLLAYGSPWRKPLGVAVIMLWVAAAAGSQRAATDKLLHRQHGG